MHDVGNLQSEVEPCLLCWPPRLKKVDLLVTTEPAPLRERLQVAYYLSLSLPLSLSLSLSLPSLSPARSAYYADESPLKYCGEESVRAAPTSSSSSCIAAPPQD